MYKRTLQNIFLGTLLVSILLGCGGSSSSGQTTPAYSISGNLNGMDNIRKKIIKLANQLRDELSKISEITLYGPEDPNQRTSIISFNISGKDPEEIVKKLEKQRIVLAVREIMDKKLVRASPHFFNTESEIQIVVDEIKRL